MVNSVTCRVIKPLQYSTVVEIECMSRSLPYYIIFNIFFKFMMRVVLFCLVGHCRDSNDAARCDVLFWSLFYSLIFVIWHSDAQMLSTGGDWKRGTGKCGTGKRGTRLQGWKTRDWKTRHQTAGVENAGVAQYGKPKSPLFNIVTSVLQQPLELMWTRRTLRIGIFLLYNCGRIVSPYLTQTRFKRQLPSFDATTWNKFSCCLQSALIC